MPHLTLEHTADLPREAAGPELFLRLHRILADAGIDMGNCKSRAVALDRHLAGDGTGPGGFVHLDVRILAGRPASLKAELGGRLLDALRSAYEAAGAAAEVTLEIRDMPREQYFKARTGAPAPPAEAAE